MKIRKTALYEAFTCAGGACPDTCCGGWNIDLDEETMEYYGSLGGKLGREIRNAVNWQEGCFRQQKGHCFLLGRDGLCEVHRRLGEEALCDTCREYPRHMEEFKGILEYHVNLSCPEVVRLLLTMEEPLRVIESEEELEQDWEEEELLEYQDQLFEELELLRSRQEELLVQAEEKALYQNPAFSQTQDLDSQDKLFGQVLCLAEELEEKLSEDNQAENNQIKDKNEEDGERITDFTGFRWKENCFALLKELAVVRASWKKTLDRMDEVLYSGGEASYEKLRTEFYQALEADPEKYAFYLKSRTRIYASCIRLYIPCAVYDGWISSKARIGLFILSLLEDLLILNYTEEQKLFDAQILCTSLAALMRELEHHDDNLNALEEFLVDASEV